MGSWQSLLKFALVIWLAGFAGGAQAQVAPFITPQPDGVRVDVELVIAVDVSGSMSNVEHDLQRKGFLAAFADDQLIRAITSGPHGQIAVTYVEWGDQSSQRILVPWRLIKDRASSLAFRDALSGQPRSPIRGTSISGALAYSAKLFADNGFIGLRKVIDVSGDGANRTGEHVDVVRDRVLQSGIVINGLPLMLSPMVRRRTHGFDLDHYFEDCVIGGPGAFVYPVNAKEELGEAIRRKLIIEVSGLPARTVPTSQRPRRKANCQIGRSYRDDW